jgi:hypothetical protein
MIWSFVILEPILLYYKHYKLGIKFILFQTMNSTIISMKIKLTINSFKIYDQYSKVILPFIERLKNFYELGFSFSLKWFFRRFKRMFILII